MGMDDNGVTGTDHFISIDLSRHHIIFFSLFNNDRIIQSSLYQSYFHFPLSVTYKRQEDADHYYGFSDLLQYHEWFFLRLLLYSFRQLYKCCLLYTSDAADERSS